jgi:hypothetical protein
MGVGAEMFNGYYDNVEVFDKMVAIAGFEGKMVMAE